MTQPRVSPYPASLVSLAAHSDHGAPEIVREWIPVFKCLSAFASITFAKVPLTTWAGSDSRCRQKIPPLDERSCKVILGRGASVRVGDICGHFCNVLRMSCWILLSKEFFMPASSPTSEPCFSSSLRHHLKFLALPQVCIWAFCSIQVSNMWTLAQSRLCFAGGLGFCGSPDFSVIVGYCFSFLLPICPSMLPYMHTSVFSSFLPSIHPSMHPYFSVSSLLPSLPSFLPSIHLSIHPCIHPYVNTSFLPSIHQSIYPSSLSSFHSSIYPFICSSSIHTCIWYNWFLFKGCVDFSLRALIDRWDDVYASSQTKWNNMGASKRDLILS